MTFGAEPKDYEIQEFVQKNYYSLQFSPAVTTVVVNETKRNPKRMQREAKKQLQTTGVGTKSQEALKLQHEQCKQERKIRSKEQKEAEEQRMFELKQLKRLEKHKGHKIGDCWDFDTERGLLCPMAMHTLFPMIDILRYGGSLSVSRAGDYRFCCPDADVINVFRIEKTDD